MTNAAQPSVKSTPYWWDGCTFPTLSTKPVSATCDVAIVGGGYTGLSAAIELARAGLHVQLFDRTSLGQAASSRNGWVVNPKRNYRLYKEMDLQLRNKVPKRRVKAKLRSDRTAATRSNDVWAMDFVHDQLATGRKIRVLTVVDTFSRFSPAVDARFSYKGEDVVQTLERVCRQVGYPATIRVDNGSEFISRDLDLWAYHRGVVLDFSRPGKPTDNSYIESFNGKFRAECLNAHWFMSLDDARAKMEDWRRDYNEFRPHSAIGNKVPISLMNGSSAPTPT
ncbi:IS3 family transposase [Agrobacterium vitis]|nr:MULTISPECIES: IS3 family transposase [Rhizobium/Agrobacterium group]